jgi:exodeoxyribonuclease V beta subunit
MATRPLDALTVPLDGPALVEASAGTGKTYAISTLFVRLVVERALEVDRILVVTFTEAAAAELRDRVRARLHDALLAWRGGPGDDDLARLAALRRAEGHAEHDLARIDAALRAFDLAAITTIHGFCHRVLADASLPDRLDPAELADDRVLVDTIVRDFLARELYAADRDLVRWVVDRRLPLAALIRIARIAASQPHVRVVPEAAQGVGADADAFRAAFAAARELWLADRDAVVAMLLEFPHFHRGKLGEDDLRAHFDDLDDYFADTRPSAAVTCRAIDALADEGLDGVLNKSAGGLRPRHAFFAACSLLVAARRPFLDDVARRLEDLKRRLAAHVRKELPKRKRKRGVRSFDDLLQDVARAVRGRHGRRLAEQLRRRHHAVLVDEFQDTDPVQWEIFESVWLRAHAPLFVIGDPKQAIYSFRGADVFTYLQAAAGVKNAYTMSTSYRADPPLVRAIERLFDVPRPFLIESIGFPAVAPRPGATASLFVSGREAAAFEVLWPEGDALARDGRIPRWGFGDELPERIATDIRALLDSGTTLREGESERPVHAGDIAVLTRTNRQAQQVQAALRKRGIPGVVYGDSTVFDTREADELRRVLAAVAEPSRVALVRAALTTELVGITANDLARMDETGREDTWGDWIERFRRWNRLWNERGFVQMFRALVEQLEAPRQLLELADGERRMTNLLHLAELMHAAATGEHLGPAGLIAWLDVQRRLAREKMVAAEAHKLRLERDDRAVQLVTIHRSKGLEYPIVYVPYAWAEDKLRADEAEHVLYHVPQDRPDAGAVRLDVGPRGTADDPIEIAQRERDAENLRLVYVAVTRARHRCVVVWGPLQGSERSPLGYLLYGATGDPLWPTFETQITATIKAQSAAQMQAHLRERARDVWSVRALPHADDARWQRAVEPAPALSVRQPRARVDRWFRVSSFSLMTSGAAAPLFVDVAVGRDHDERSGVAAPVTTASALAPASPLVSFPRGAAAGNFFHDVLEHLDFAADDEQIAGLVEGRLRAHGYEPSWAPAVVAGLRELLELELPDGAGRLSRLPRAHRLDELEFVFPVAHGGRMVAPRDLAAAIREHPGGLPAGYAERVARLRFAPLHGYLKGFVDLAFVSAGRWWIVDYKSNHLGDTAESYAAERLGDAMAHDHYVLQYHLYTIALVRHLQRKLPEFDYERDFGGVLYLFLRGISRERGATCGVWSERPPLARLRAISQVLDGGREGSR